MGILLIVLGVALIAMGALLTIAVPIGGIVAIAGGIFAVVYGQKYKKQKRFTKEEPFIQRPKEESVKTSKEPSKQSLLDKSSTAKPVNQSVSRAGERHRVAGTSFRQKEIESLGDPNYEYELTKEELIEENLVDEKVYEMTFAPKDVQLAIEPEGSQFAGAIRVIIDGVHVGYIKKGSVAHVKKQLQSDSIKAITANIEGGKYKIVKSVYDDEDDEEKFIMERDKSDYYISIYIHT